MNKFIKQLIVFLIPLLIIFILLEYTIRQIPNTYKYKNEWMLQHADSLNTLILGNSHCMSGVNPFFLTNAFNFANSSQDLERDYFILTKYDNLYTGLKYVILDKYKYSLEITSSITYEKIKEYLKGNISQCSPLGFRVNKAFKDNLDISGIKAAKRHTMNNREGLVDNLRFLDKIIRFCENKQIKLILVTTPTYPSYYNYLNENQLHLLFSTAKEIVNNHENVI